jgi:predicted DNA-binding transcriptional regulator AlpA
MSESKKIIPLRQDDKMLVQLTAAELRQLIREEVGNAQPKAKPEEEWVDAKRAAAIMGVSPDWVFHNHKRLKLPSKRVGNKMIRFSASGLREWMASNKA